MENDKKIFDSLPKLEKLKKEPRKSYLRLNKEDMTSINEAVPGKDSGMGMAMIKNFFSKEKETNLVIKEPPSTSFNDVDEGVNPERTLTRYSLRSSSMMDIQRVDIGEFLDDFSEHSQTIDFDKVNSPKQTD